MAVQSLNLITGEGAPPQYEAVQFLGTQESADEVQAWVESRGARVTIVVVGDERRLILYGANARVVVEGTTNWVIRHVETNAFYMLPDARVQAEME